MQARTPKLALGAAAVLALGACASASPPVAQMSTARTLVSQAQPQAARYAPTQLRQAQAKLQLAETAMARGDNAEARRLAEEASVDAQLAMSMAESERLKLAVAEVNQSIRTLREQLEGRAQ